MKEALEDYSDRKVATTSSDFDVAEEDPDFSQETVSSCGLAAVQMVLYRLLGRHLTHEQLVKESSRYAGYYTDDAGTMLSNMVAMINGLKWGLTASATKAMSLGDLQENTTKGALIIARVKPGHFVVITEIEGSAPARTKLGTIDPSSKDTRVFYVLDPWPPGKGKKHEWTASQFQTKTTALYTVVQKG